MSDNEETQGTESSATATGTPQFAPVHSYNSMRTILVIICILSSFWQLGIVWTQQSPLNEELQQLANTLKIITEQFPPQLAQVKQAIQSAESGATVNKLDARDCRRTNITRAWMKDVIEFFGRIAATLVQQNTSPEDRQSEKQSIMEHFQKIKEAEQNSVADQAFLNSKDSNLIEVLVGNSLTTGAIQEAITAWAEGTHGDASITIQEAKAKACDLYGALQTFHEKLFPADLRDIYPRRHLAITNEEDGDGDVQMTTPSHRGKRSLNTLPSLANTENEVASPSSSPQPNPPKRRRLAGMPSCEEPPPKQPHHRSTRAPEPTHIPRRRRSPPPVSQPDYKEFLSEYQTVSPFTPDIRNLFVDSTNRVIPGNDGNPIDELINATYPPLPLGAHPLGIDHLTPYLTPSQKKRAAERRFNIMYRFNYTIDGRLLPIDPSTDAQNGFPITVHSFAQASPEICRELYNTIAPIGNGVCYLDDLKRKKYHISDPTTKKLEDVYGILVTKINARHPKTEDFANQLQILHDMAYDSELLRKQIVQGRADENATSYSYTDAQSRKKITIEPLLRPDNWAYHKTHKGSRDYAAQQGFDVATQHVVISPRITIDNNLLGVRATQTTLPRSLLKDYDLLSMFLRQRIANMEPTETPNTFIFGRAAPKHSVYDEGNGAPNLARTKRSSRYNTSRATDTIHLGNYSLQPGAGAVVGHFNVREKITVTIANCRPVTSIPKDPAKQQKSRIRISQTQKVSLQLRHNELLYFSDPTQAAISFSHSERGHPVHFWIGISLLNDFEKHITDPEMHYRIPGLLSRFKFQRSED